MGGEREIRHDVIYPPAHAIEIPQIPEFPTRKIKKKERKKVL